MNRHEDKPWIKAVVQARKGQARAIEGGLQERALGVLKGEQLYFLIGTSSSRLH